MYLYKFKEGRFLKMLPDGNLKPYMRKSMFAGWMPDARCENAKKNNGCVGPTSSYNQREGEQNPLK